jgi:uncharacterized protein YjiS (DUF1127 family)
MQAILQFYRNRRARRQAAQTLAEMDAAALKDIGMGEILPWTLTDMGRNSRR